jgi:hypothetical protein
MEAAFGAGGPDRRNGLTEQVEYGNVAAVRSGEESTVDETAPSLGDAPAG